ncbi:MAG: hypothetical protein M1522_05225 [Actinobacteria bacterium]|nr:hypothetical protein [Actinomycetota bacterium]
MKHVAPLAYPQTPRDDLAPLAAGETATCCVCGGVADGRPVDNKSLWSDAFTNFASLAHRRNTICSPCRHAATTKALNRPGEPISLTKTPPQGAAGFVIEQENVAPLPGGLFGVELLMELSTRTSPFGVLIGRWKAMEVRHYWMQIPTTYGARVYPVLYVRSADESPHKGPLPTVWLHMSYVERVVSAAREAIESAGSFKKVKGAVLKTDQYPDLKALLTPRSDGWEYGPAGIPAATVVRHVFFAGTGE